MAGLYQHPGTNEKALYYSVADNDYFFQHNSKITNLEIVAASIKDLFDENRIPDNDEASCFRLVRKHMQKIKKRYYDEWPWSDSKEENDFLIRLRKPQNHVEFPEPNYTFYPLGNVIIGYRSRHPMKTGFFNENNSCYLNSVLQALFHVPSFAKYLLRDHRHVFVESTNKCRCSICDMKYLLERAKKNRRGVMLPFVIINRLQEICKTMRNGSHEDAHEFLRCLLNLMERDYLNWYDVTDLDERSKETTPINQIFGGYFRTELQCLECQYISTTFQHFQELELDIKKNDTVDTAVARYFQPVEVEDYDCEFCSTKVLARKRIVIERPPKVLCLQLKRFRPTLEKLKFPVRFNLDISLEAYLRQSTEANYQYLSQISHEGFADYGHYVTVADLGYRRFYEFDDAIVRKVEFEHIYECLTERNYVMFYEMESSEKFEDSMENISEDESPVKNKYQFRGGTLSKIPGVDNAEWSDNGPETAKPKKNYFNYNNEDEKRQNNTNNTASECNIATKRSKSTHDDHSYDWRGDLDNFLHIPNSVLHNSSDVEQVKDEGVTVDYRSETESIKSDNERETESLSDDTKKMYIEK